MLLNNNRTLDALISQPQLRPLGLAFHLFPYPIRLYNICIIHILQKGY